MNISFMWHMHQPDYRDGSGVMQMPWVFLHAIKDYYDMPWMLARHEGLKATFNITPPLIEQLKLYYEEPQKNDRFLNLWMQDLVLLNETDRNWMIKLCKSTPFETMVLALPSYAALHKKEHYNDNELFDMQVLFILSWCGIYLRSSNDLISRLIKKERHYNNEDKRALLHELSKFVSTIFDYYTKLYQDGRISISTTPLNHPILPLLMDMENAVKANHSTKIPKQHTSLEDDAVLQVTRAQALFLETFGFEAEGFWPAEGAVDEKSVALLKECGIKWIATDEAILFKSLGHADRSTLYSPYNYNELCIGFRDHGLSDHIGFTYRYWEANKAADHFISSLSSINKNSPDGTVFIILDGENAWEFFHNNAFDFFDALYTKINNTPWCKTLHMDDVAKLPTKPLNKLAPGSWIHGEFNTWVGHSEKTRGWELIYLTKRDFNHHKTTLDSETKDKITNHFLAAECSDWFWWYGDDHFTEFGTEFDMLFRSHLISIYDLMHIAPPSDLFETIIGDRSSQKFWLRPQSHISPTTNGLHDSFFEWIGCGVVDESKLFSTMDRVRGPVSKILYGQDETSVYFAFNADISQIHECDTIGIIIEPIEFNESVELHAFKSANYEEHFGNIKVEIAAKNMLEIRIDKSSIKTDQIQIRFELTKGGVIIQTLPGFGELEIDLATDYSENWFV
ncbi:glycoside hydrolase family 57 protein [Candidatus Sulfurimonas baltica]|uniref:Glycoside hydrolase n=1 Tax=Candidatus Sulfurimonas baltica TaxID=2740404 RepID=A0A7S7LUZ6_9BACT|nr:glycoside hydrolase family 57 protein [Candidatus Sulfurimonas baltica]QOY51802.1 glycoside hydrolase [Candidatus Sulfurimonas baltica]